MSKNIYYKLLGCSTTLSWNTAFPPMPTNLSHNVSSVRPVLFASMFAMGTFAASGYLKYKSSNTCMSSSWSFFKMFKKYTHSHNSFFYPIAAANVAVFGLWNWRGRSTRFLQGFLQEHFVYIHGVSSTFSLLGCTFSHKDADHLGIGHLRNVKSMHRKDWYL